MVHFLPIHFQVWENPFMSAEELKENIEPESLHNAFAEQNFKRLYI
jgi:hypothetical protein